MERWRLLDLGYSEPLMAQTFYESVAEAVHRGESPNTLILLQPDSQYACLGYHQDLEQELDLDFLKEKGLPVIRRSQGGGATYLDSNQIFYQIVFKDSGAVSRDIERLFEKLLAVTVETYRRLGVPAEYKPVNDVVVGGRKISGNGAGRHESATILVGNIIIDLNYDLMARVLRVPDEKFRDKMAKSMVDWVTTLKRELQNLPSVEEIKKVYSDVFQELLRIKLCKGEPSELERRIYDEETMPRHTSEEWLYMESMRPERMAGRAVKIAHDVKMVEADHKAGKLIRVRSEMVGSEIRRVQIMGDLFVVPKEAVDILEEMLRGVELERTELRSVVDRFYEATQAQTPGITTDDLVEALFKMHERL